MLRSRYFNRDIPCVFKNSSYGSKGLVYNQSFYSDFDSRGVITVQKNALTQKIFNGMRYCFEHSKEDIYQVAKVNAVFDKGIYSIVCKNTRYVQEDDIENNYAFNSCLDYDDDRDLTEMKIVRILGKDFIKIGDIQQFIIEGYDNTDVTFSLDEYTVDMNIATIIESSDKMCKIKGLKEDVAQLEARNSEGTLLAVFSIYIIPIDKEGAETWGF